MCVCVCVYKYMHVYMGMYVDAYRYIFFLLFLRNVIMLFS